MGSNAKTVGKGTSHVPGGDNGMNVTSAADRRGVTQDLRDSFGKFVAQTEMDFTPRLAARFGDCECASFINSTPLRPGYIQAMPTRAAVN